MRAAKSGFGETIFALFYAPTSYPTPTRWVLVVSIVGGGNLGMLFSWSRCISWWFRAGRGIYNSLRVEICEREGGGGIGQVALACVPKSTSEQTTLFQLKFFGVALHMDVFTAHRDMNGTIAILTCNRRIVLCAQKSRRIGSQYPQVLDDGRSVADGVCRHQHGSHTLLDAPSFGLHLGRLLVDSRDALQHSSRAHHKFVAGPVTNLVAFSDGLPEQFPIAFLYGGADRGGALHNTRQ